MKRRSEAAGRSLPSHCQSGGNWRSWRNGRWTIRARITGGHMATMATMSYVSGTSDVPLIGNTIGQQLEETAAAFPGPRWRWWCASSACGSPGASSTPRSTSSRPGCWRSASRRATASASGRPTTSNGCSPSSPPPGRAWCSCASTRPIGCTSSTMRSTRRAARALVTATAFKTSDYAGMLLELLPELRRCPPGRLEAAPRAGAAHRSSRSAR